jgi:hypothetical protein
VDLSKNKPWDLQPGKDLELIRLTRRRWAVNPAWGSPRIRNGRADIVLLAREFLREPARTRVFSSGLAPLLFSLEVRRQNERGNMEMKLQAKPAIWIIEQADLERQDEKYEETRQNK